MHHNMVKGRYTKVKKNVNFVLINICATVGVACGNIFVIVEPNNMELRMVYVFAAVFMEILSCLFALGGTSFLKLYYIAILKKD